MYISFVHFLFLIASKTHTMLYQLSLFVDIVSEASTLVYLPVSLYSTSDRYLYHLLPILYFSVSLLKLVPSFNFFSEFISVLISPIKEREIDRYIDGLIEIQRLINRQIERYLLWEARIDGGKENKLDKLKDKSKHID